MDFQVPPAPGDVFAYKQKGPELILEFAESIRGFSLRTARTPNSEGCEKFVFQHSARLTADEPVWDNPTMTLTADSKKRVVLPGAAPGDVFM